MRASFVALSVCLVIGLATAASTVARGKGSGGSRFAPAVAVVTTPGGGIQPQAVVDAQGSIHLLFFTGAPAGGDLSYVRLAVDGSEIGKPIRVNSIPGTALATGSVRGGQISVGAGGRVHVAWHGSKPVAGTEVPVWYARSSSDRTRFEPQRAVSGTTTGIDGGSVAADQNGHVAVVWHAMGAQPGENNRTVYLARSSDDGATMSREAPATAAPTGACGCCGLRALFDRGGALHILYRAATDSLNRDATWLMLKGTVAQPPVRVHRWELKACPMTTFALAEAGENVVAAWETAEQIYSTTLNPRAGTIAPVAELPGTGSRKHPSIAVNAAGDRLMAWTEGTAWNKGGVAAWELTDRAGQRLAGSANAGPVPVWGLVSAVALRDGSFIILR